MQHQERTSVLCTFSKTSESSERSAETSTTAQTAALSENMTVSTRILIHHNERKEEGDFSVDDSDESTLADFSESCDDDSSLGMRDTDCESDMHSSSEIAVDFDFESDTEQDQEGDDSFSCDEIIQSQQPARILSWPETGETSVSLRSEKEDHPTEDACATDVNNRSLTFDDYHGGRGTETNDIPLKEQFRFNKQMSVGQMETVMDTVIRAENSLKKDRRLSFGFAFTQQYDKARPACVIAEGCLTRMNQWDPNPNKGESTNSKPKKLKSILKKIGSTFTPRFPMRRGSFFGNKDVQTSAPQRPGRRGSFYNEDTQQQVKGGTAAPARPARRGSFLGFSNGGKTSDQLSPAPKKPGRRSSFLGGKTDRVSQSDVSKPQRRLSFLGFSSSKQTSALGKVERRRSFLGYPDRCANEPGNDMDQLIPSTSTRPQRRLSFLGSNHRRSEAKRGTRRRASFLGLSFESKESQERTAQTPSSEGNKEVDCVPQKASPCLRVEASDPPQSPPPGLCTEASEPPQPHFVDLYFI